MAGMPPVAGKTNRRGQERYRIFGFATLNNANLEIRGQLIDVSMRGVGILVEDMPANLELVGTSWLCVVQSKDLPVAVEAFVRVKRNRRWGKYCELGCEMLMIDQLSKRSLKAFRGLARSRGWAVK